MVLTFLPPKSIQIILYSRKHRCFWLPTSQDIRRTCLVTWLKSHDIYSVVFLASHLPKTFSSMQFWACCNRSSFHTQAKTPQMQEWSKKAATWAFLTPTLSQSFDVFLGDGRGSCQTTRSKWKTLVLGHWFIDCSFSGAGLVDADYRQTCSHVRAGVSRCATSSSDSKCPQSAFQSFCFQGVMNLIQRHNIIIARKRCEPPGCVAFKLSCWLFGSEYLSRTKKTGLFLDMFNFVTFFQDQFLLLLIMPGLPLLPFFLSTSHFWLFGSWTELHIAQKIEMFFFLLFLSTPIHDSSPFMNDGQAPKGNKLERQKKLIRNRSQAKRHYH